ncbi:MAG: hypothetical protein OXP36_06155 [Gammaproteobacteria bacterium]|nr:hypothetical protein [Gammaproteobacteria bacterium]
MTVDWPTIAVIVAIGGLLWRQIAALDARLVALASRVDGLSDRLGMVDSRLARLEGWIEGERAGRTAGATEEAPA